jgi:hypothetical protein
MSDASEVGQWLRLTEAARRTGVNVASLRRWCASRDGEAFARRRGRGWEVNFGQLQWFLTAHRRAGSSSVRFQGFNFLGHVPNVRLKDASGWRFAIGNGTEPALIFSVWVSSELIQHLQANGYEVFQLLLRAGERLAEDKLLNPDELWQTDRTIELGWPDLSRLLTAAGRTPDFLLPSEAPFEEGVPIEYSLTARDFADKGLWVGSEYLVGDHTQFGDLIVDWTAEGGRRSVRTVRLKLPIDGDRRQAVMRALNSYRERCARLAIIPGAWAQQVQSRLGLSPPK